VIGDAVVYFLKTGALGPRGEVGSGTMFKGGARGVRRSSETNLFNMLLRRGEEQTDLEK